MNMLKRDRMRRREGVVTSGSERGAVLIVVVILSAITLAVATSLLYMITASTKISGMGKCYQTAKEASFGAVEVVGQMVFSIQTPTNNGSGPSGPTTFLDPMNPIYPNLSGCTGIADGGKTVTGLNAKILAPSSTWTGCDKTSRIDPADPSTYDFSFDIGASMGASIGSCPVYRVYAKLVDTQRGNTLGGYAGKEAGVRLDTHQGVVSLQAELPMQLIPFSYVMEIDTRNLSNSANRSRLSVFYHY